MTENLPLIIYGAVILVLLIVGAVIAERRDARRARRMRDETAEFAASRAALAPKGR